MSHRFSTRSRPGARNAASALQTLAHSADPAHNASMGNVHVPLCHDRHQVSITQFVRNVHDFEGFTRNFSTLGVNHAGINASTTCSHEYPPAKRRWASESTEENTSRVIAQQRCPKVMVPLANANCSEVDPTVGVRWRMDCAERSLEKANTLLLDGAAGGTPIGIG